MVIDNGCWLVHWLMRDVGGGGDGDGDGDDDGDGECGGESRMTKTL